VRKSTTTPPRASHAVLSRRHQHYSTTRLTRAAYRQWRTCVRPSISLRPPADLDPCTHPAVPMPLVASLPAFHVPPSQQDVLPRLGPTTRTSTIASWTSHTTPPLRGADTNDATNARSTIDFVSHPRSSSARSYKRHVVHRLGRRLHPAPRLTPVARPRFYTGMHPSALPRPPLDPGLDNLLSTHTLSSPPPHDSPSSVCPTKPLPGPTFPQPGNTLCPPSTRAVV
jgi:hypothetical protein